jgi:hypothetical protein
VINQGVGSTAPFFLRCCCTWRRTNETSPFDFNLLLAPKNSEITKRMVAIAASFAFAHAKITARDIITSDIGMQLFRKKVD